MIVAEPHRLIRAGLRLLLEWERDIVVVGEAARGEDVVAETRRLGPDVVLIDVGIPGMDALRTTRLIFDDLAGRARVLLLSTADNDAEALAALRAGARGVVRRDSTPDELRRAARRIAAGGALLTAEVTRRLAAELVAGRSHDAIVPPELDVLTAREREVLGLVGHGFSNSEIATRLAVSPTTVKSHVAGAIAKLDARDRAGLVTLAYETGLVRPSREAGGPARRT